MIQGMSYEGRKTGPQYYQEAGESGGVGAVQCRRNSGEWFLTLEGRQKYLV